MTIDTRAIIGTLAFGALLIVVVVVASVVDNELGHVEDDQDVNRIAYVSLDGQIHTIAPDGTDDQQLTQGEGFYTWPTWAPDSKNLVFSGVTNRDAQNPTVGLFAVSSQSGTRREIYRNETVASPFLANGVVHYPLWSPDSKHVAFIAVTSRGLTLYVDDLEPDSASEAILDNGPLWINWSPDSENLLVHRRSDLFLVDILDGLKPVNLNKNALRYRVPAWNPSGNSAVLASDDTSGGATIYEANVDVDGIDNRRDLTSGLRNPSFLWSPNGSYLATASVEGSAGYLGTTLAVYLDLTLNPADDTRSKIAIQGDVVAYFWSPDGSKLAYVTFSRETRGALALNVFNLDVGESQVLAEFIPSSDQLTMLQFFDQYYYSHPLWSPDSNSLVFSGRLNAEGITASYGFQESQGPFIIVADMEPVPSARVIVEGGLATWSPK